MALWTLHELPSSRQFIFKILYWCSEAFLYLKTAWNLWLEQAAIFISFA